MPDEERDRYIKDFRWCPYSETIQPWEEDQDQGCVWCDVDMDSLGPHLKLVLARASDEAWSAYERLREHVNVLHYAEMGEPESVVAQMWSYYTATCKSKTPHGQITNLVRGLAQAALIAIGNGRWARLEHAGALKLQAALNKALSHHAHKEGLCEGCDNAREVIAAVKLDDKPPEPPFAVLLDLPVPDPPPEPKEPVPEAPEPATEGVDA